MEEKGAGGYGVLPASEFKQAPSFGLAFHSVLTLRVSYYAPPDTVHRICEQLRLNICSK